MSNEPAFKSRLQEALGMASMVALRDDLTVELGEWWAFNWKTNVITIPQRELEECPEERIAWIILHEAAHAALTRFHEIVPDGILQSSEVAMLLNTLEDVRIEEWLVERFPGARQWRDVARRVDQERESSPEELSKEETPEQRMRGFLEGLFDLGRTGGFRKGLGKRVMAALEKVRIPFDRAVECRPPVSAVRGDVISLLYNSHPVAWCYRATDEEDAPDPFEKWVRVMQATMWFHIVEGILPVYSELLELPPLRNKQAMLLKVASRVSGTRCDRTPEEMRRDLRRELAKLDAGPYQRSVERNAEEVRRVTDILMELLPNHRALRHRRNFRSGDRLDIRAAFRAEADPRFVERMWMRRTRATLPDPAFLCVMDRSESMKENGRNRAAFDALVIVREACTRLRIPFVVIAFNDFAEVIHGWDVMEDDRCQAALGLILNAESGTNIPGALELAAKVIAARPERDRFVFVMTDGCIGGDQIAEVRRVRDEMEEAGVRFAAIGVSCGDGIRDVFPEAASVENSEELPGVFADSLVRMTSSFRA